MLWFGGVPKQTSVWKVKGYFFVSCVAMIEIRNWMVQKYTKVAKYEGE